MTFEGDLPSKPELVDNQSGPNPATGEPRWTHEEALSHLLHQCPHPLSVASAFFNLDGANALAILADERPTRLLLGAEPDPALGAPIPLARFEQQIAALRSERDVAAFPPSRALEKLVAVRDWLELPNVEVRRYTETFLHGKAYLLGTKTNGHSAIVTSANATGPGLGVTARPNRELGLVTEQKSVVQAAVAWFDEMWGMSAEYKEALIELLFPGPGLVDPQDVYLRALLDLYGGSELGQHTPDRLTLAPFQVEGLQRAREILDRWGGVIYADGVGTGKTEIGLALVEEYTQLRDGYALVVAPPTLARRWQRRIDALRMPAQVVTFGDLTRDEQLNPEGPGSSRVLSVLKDSYSLIVIDEAHALRNPDTTWRRAAERLVGGKDKHVVLLTATPINNGLWDLFHMVMLFARHDRAFDIAGIDSLRALFLNAGATSNDPDEIAPDVLFPLANLVSVRRDRRFIENRWPDARFPDGTPVKFPSPELDVVRYDLSAADDTVVRIAAAIDALTMARYSPDLYLVDPGREVGEAKVAHLLKSALLKRFESCWHACLLTTNKMLAAHDAFLAAWEAGSVLSGEALREAAAFAEDDGSLAEWVDEAIESAAATRPTTDFDPKLAEDVRADRLQLASIHDRLAAFSPDTDEKLQTLGRLLEQSAAEKAIVFATYADTIRYLDQHLPTTIGGRDRVVVIGSETTPDQRLETLVRFAPKSIDGPERTVPDEADLLLSTDVLAEGQNLQQAQTVISYDMPWNPQKVVQRNGRVIRLLSPHDTVQLVTMLPMPGDLEPLLRLEQRIRLKLKAARVFGTETPVLDAEDEVVSLVQRLDEGDASILDDADELAGAFVGEELRSLIDRAFLEGTISRIESLPWGVGAGFIRTHNSKSRGPAGVFFNIRTPAMRNTGTPVRYWRHVPLANGDDVIVEDLPILRAIEPTGSTPITSLDNIPLDALWERAATSVLDEHLHRVEQGESGERLGPAQHWALSVLSNPDVELPTEAASAYDALSVGRTQLVRHQLNQLRDRVQRAEVSLDGAAREIVELVRRLGLRPVATAKPLNTFDPDELAVVCFMVVVDR